MRLRFSPAVFMLAYCIVYVAVLATDFPAFRYYPLDGTFSWGAGKATGHGPAMAWYGLMAWAGLAGLVAAVAIPGGWLERRLRNLLWIFPAATLLASLYLMRIFFL